MPNLRDVSFGLGFSLSLLCLGSTSGVPAADGKAAKPSEAGDANRIRWVRPYAEAVKQAKATNRLILAKPIMGGSNTPKPGGLPAGGKTDCDGSW